MEGPSSWPVMIKPAQLTLGFEAFEVLHLELLGHCDLSYLLKYCGKFDAASQLLSPVLKINPFPGRVSGRANLQTVGWSPLGVALKSPTYEGESATGWRVSTIVFLSFF